MSAIIRRYNEVRSRETTALLILFIISYTTIFTDASLRINAVQLAAVIVVGIIYLIISLEGANYIRQSLGARHHNWPMLLAFFAIQIFSAEIINYITKLAGNSWLLFLPIVTFAISLLPIRGVVAICLIILGLITFNVSTILGPTANILQLTISSAAAIIFVALFSQVAKQERVARFELDKAHQKLREYASQVEELTITKERNRVAREIHDSVGHYLTIINVQIGAAMAIIEQNPKQATEALSKAQSLTREGLAEIRRSITALRASPLDNKSLEDAIKNLVAESQAAGIETKLQVVGKPRPLETSSNLALYRVVQEGLTNIRKHSQASEAQLELDYSNSNQICLEIADNGRGKTIDNTGFGLMGMRERIELLGGTMQVETAPGQGFKLKVELPL